MRYLVAAGMAAIIVAAAPAAAESIPEWVKNSAGWWADGVTSDAEFVGAIQYLIGVGIISVEQPDQVENAGEGIPEWVKNSAGWWADGVTSDAEFVGAIQYLIGVGIISVEQPEPAEDPRMAELEAELAACSQYTKAYQRLDCESDVERQITRLRYEADSVPYQVGSVTYYYPGAKLETTEGGQPLLTIRMLAANDGTDNVSLMCTGPAVCNYDVTDGSTAYKYAATDFTSGSITIKPGEAREFEMIFGPNIGYGGTTFVYDPSKQYHFRISESFGSASIPLNLE